MALLSSVVDAEEVRGSKQAGLRRGIGGGAPSPPPAELGPFSNDIPCVPLLVAARETRSEKVVVGEDHFDRGHQRCMLVC